MTKAPKGENFKHTTILAGANAYPQRGVVEAVVRADKAERIADAPTVIRDKCGTTAGYYAHRWYKEAKCDACLSAQREFAAQWRKTHPEQVRQSSNKYLRANREFAATSWRRKRAKVFGVESEPYTASDILAAHGTDCHICGEPIDLNASRSNSKEDWHRGLQLDHVIPISKGGSDLISNVKPAHGLCNRLKHNKIIEEEA